MKTTFENIDKITSPIASSVIITEEELTGDLPQEYGETRIVLQTRDPHWAWVYWEFSSIERKKVEDELGAFEFAHTKLFLKVFNKTMNYSFDVNLPDICDNWYLSLNDSDCDYYVQLCLNVPTTGIRVLATSELIHLPTDKVSENIAKWVSPNTEEDISISGREQNTTKDDFVEYKEENIIPIDSFELSSNDRDNLAFNNYQGIDNYSGRINPFGSSEKIYKEHKESSFNSKQTDTDNK